MNLPEGKTILSGTRHFHELDTSTSFASDSADIAIFGKQRTAGGAHQLVRRPLRLSARTRKFQPSLTLQLKQIVQQRRASGLPVYDFGLGETKGTLTPRLEQAVSSAVAGGDTGYVDPAGILELREEILHWLNVDEHYTPDNVVVSGGAKQCLLNVFLALCNPGDVALLSACPWVSYVPIMHCVSAVPVPVVTAAGAENHFRVTADDLRRQLRLFPLAKLFLLNSPCNPTGQVYTAEEIEALLQVCVEHRVFMVLDRIYWRTVFDGREYPEPRIDAETKPWLIQIDGLSKSFRRAGGLRVGWSVAPDDVAAAMVNVQSHHSSGAATPCQLGALDAIRAPYDTEMQTALTRKRDLMRDAIAQIPGIAASPMEGAFYSFWDVRALFGSRTPQGDTLRSSQDVATYFLEQHGVVTAAGEGFFQEGFLRVCFFIDDDSIKHGMKAVAKAVAQLSF